jgi:hypothetical protein
MQTRILLTTTLTTLTTLTPLAIANHGPGTSGGGTSTVSGETLRQGGFDLSLRTDYTKFENVSRAEAEQEAIAHGEFDAIDHSWIESFSVAYGITDDFQISAMIGYYAGSDFVDAEEDGGGGAESATADPRGLTDTWLQGKWRVMRGANGHLSLVGGVKLPTGKDDETLSNGEELEPSSQPGSGAFDYQLGAAYSRYLTSRMTLDASAVYTLRTEHDDFQVGDRFDVGVAAAWRLTEDVRAFPNWSVSGELLGTWLDEDEDDGVANENSGGEIVYFATGLRARFNPHVALTVAPALPVYQETNGAQVDTDAKLSLALSVSL